MGAAARKVVDWNLIGRMTTRAHLMAVPAPKFTQRWLLERDGDGCDHHRCSKGEAGRNTKCEQGQLVALVPAALEARVSRQDVVASVEGSVRDEERVSRHAAHQAARPRNLLVCAAAADNLLYSLTSST